MAKFIKVVEADGVVDVILNRPELRNAFNPQMISEITKAFKSLAKRKDLRVVVLRGEGKSFCAGADLHWMKEMVNYSIAKNKKDSEALFDMFQSIATCSHPIVGVVQGAAFGGALGLLACCDIVIAEERALFGFSEVKLGLAPAVISHFVLKKTSLGKCVPLMITGKNFTAEEARESGLVHIVASPADMGLALNQVLNQFGEAGPEAVRETKALLLKVQNLPANKAKRLTTQVIAKRRVSAEGQEGLTGFLTKQTPSWNSKWKARS